MGFEDAQAGRAYTFPPIDVESEAEEENPKDQVPIIDRHPLSTLPLDGQDMECRIKIIGTSAADKDESHYL
ncbi:hypothetical protein F0562_032187 [Nyssa sinensis]|uniref:Uncharacterized protein n=1 Tax=Nyssa sinensis TaxID=561372 RepID=A0A5J5AWM3_9ASTE|nr:hypothetical protein F0562_032187 [Nyssa sinensis]